MWKYFNSLSAELQQMAAQMDREHWIAVSVLVLLFGVFCMRGYGSRSSY